ncbi:Transposase [Cordylochernes scorpioides]|uniref:Transposase n=1 Tax=Cordylochernes scorpioides TaxID=51811 RepID=A0ABY6KGC7_9ARAC|nr:Transposase [Cordylochernes scorpioides]
MMADSGQRTMDEDGEHYVDASEVPATFIRPSLANLVNRLTEALQEVTASRAMPLWHLTTGLIWRKTFSGNCKPCRTTSGTLLRGSTSSSKVNSALAGPSPDEKGGGGAVTSSLKNLGSAGPADSTLTISRRLVANGLHSCRPLRRLPLTPPNRRQRLEWCRARSTWMTEWHRVVFSDESRFCLSSDSRRVRVWRRRGERSNPAAIVERPTVRQRGIIVWGAIAYDSRSPLLRIQGTMTAQRYVDDVLRPVTLPYLQGVPNALYQQDNARPHTARISQQALQDVQMLPWPPYSPDLSPIEHVWDIIGRRLHALPQPRLEDELWQMVEREWRAIPQDAIRTLIDSLPRRVAACIAVRGGPTCY